MKLKQYVGSHRKDLLTYGVVILGFVIMQILSSAGMLSSSVQGYLVPICAYIVLAVSLNLVVGISGELSLGHAGFMGVGAFTGIVMAAVLKTAIANKVLLLIVSMLCGGVVAGLFGKDVEGLHFAIGTEKPVLADGGSMIVNGPMGATGVAKLASFPVGFALILVTLFVVLNLVNSKEGRAIKAVRDNRIAAESVGINVTAFRLKAFVVSAFLAGMAGALYGLNYSSLTASKFNFNTSINILVFVVLGGMGNILGSVISATVLYVLPEAMRGLQDYRMILYAIVLILVMLFTWSPKVKEMRSVVSAKIGGLFKKKEAGTNE